MNDPQAGSHEASDRKGSLFRLSPTMTTTTGTVDVSSAWGDLELHYGTPSIPGIRFTGSITYPSGFSGEAALFQIASPLRRRKLNSGVWQRWTATGVFDSTNGDFPYDEGTSASDSPGSSLSADYLEHTAQDSFRMWLMFKPSGDSIWVPMRYVDWNWYGSAVRSGSTWNKTSGGSNQNPASVSSTDFPRWTANSITITWVVE